MKIDEGQDALNLLASAATLQEKEALILKWAQELQVQREQIVRENEEFVGQKNFVEKVLEKRLQTTVVNNTIGSISEYSMNQDWNNWYERFEQYIIANDIAEGKWTSLFLTLIGSEAYALLRNLCTPQSPSSKTLNELADLMTNYLKPKPSVIAERYKFKECKQGVKEDIKTYVAKLMKLSENCQFGDNLEESIRDQFVWGISSANIKSRLIRDRALTYKKAIETALSMEAAGREVAEMCGTTTEDSEVNYVNEARPHQRNVSRNFSCYCCGRKGHMSSDCRYRNLCCNRCGKKGHLASVCKVNADVKENQKDAKGKANTKDEKKRESKHNFIQETDDFDEVFNRICTIENEKVDTCNNIRPILVELEIENALLNCEVDTGSPISAVSDKIRKEISELSNKQLKATCRKFKTYTGDVIIPRGVIEVTVKYRDRSSQLDLFVFPGESAPIVGRDWISTLKIIDFESNCEIKLIENEKKMKEIIEEFPGVFQTR